MCLKQWFLTTDHVCPPGGFVIVWRHFDGHDRVEGAAGTWCAEARDAGKSPTTHGAALTIEGYTET